MKILFVSSGNSKNGISPIIKNQGMSLIDIGHEVTFYTVKGKGIKGYFKNIFTLRDFLKKNSFEVIHAHYSLSAMVASLAGAKPLVVSLMGSDVKASRFLKYIIGFFTVFFWKKVIVKSLDMKKAAGLEEAYIIPNGVNFKKFKPIAKKDALEITKWDATKKHVLFAANPKRPEKNYSLAEKAFSLLKEKDVQLHTLVDIPNEEMPYYFNAADVVLLTSLWEGSPNVIKEAMACNCKIVAVDVGDIKQVMSGVVGCYVTSFDAEEIKEAIQKTLGKDGCTNGRLQIENLQSEVIAHQIIDIYKQLL